MSWCGCAVGHVYVDAERPHNVHANEAGRRLQAHNDNEAGPTTSFAPRAESYRQFVVVCHVHRALCPQTTVAPPNSEPHAGHRGSRVHLSKDRDAFYRELA